MNQYESKILRNGYILTTNNYIDIQNFNNIE